VIIYNHLCEDSTNYKPREEVFVTIFNVCSAVTFFLLVNRINSSTLQYIRLNQISNMTTMGSSVYRNPRLVFLTRIGCIDRKSPYVKEEEEK
jgi:hypothetical protein